MLHRRLILSCCLLCPVVTIGCTGTDDAARVPAVSDSAGIRVVQTPGDVVQYDGAWRVSADPAVTIGSASGDEAYLFDRIMGVERLSDGRWAVADMGSSQIRFFDARGRHVQSVGAQGQGPGEFRQVMALQKLAGDTLAVMDGFSFVHILAPTGAFAGMITLGRRPSLGITAPAGAFRDGTLLARITSATPQQLTEPHTMTHSLSRVRLERDASDAISLVVLDTLGTWPARRLVPGWRGGAEGVEFELAPILALMSDGIVVGDPGTNEIRLYDAKGSLVTLVRRDWTPEPVTDEHIARRREQYVNMPGEGGAPVSERLLQQRAEIAEQWKFADHLPAFSRLVVDADDNIWLRDYVPAEETVGQWHAAPLHATRWTVLNRAGETLAHIELPARFKPMHFGSGVVAGVYRDDAEVEYVHVYELEKS